MQRKTYLDHKSQVHKAATMKNERNANGPAASTFEPSAIQYEPGEKPLLYPHIDTGQVMYLYSATVKYVHHNITPETKIGKAPWIL